MSGVSSGVAVVSHPQRDEMAAVLADEVGGLVVRDHGCVGGVGDMVGCARTHARALRLLARSDAEWLIVLEDDAVPVPDFRVHAEHALAHAHHPVVGLYLGTGTNPDVQAVIELAIRSADGVGAVWITADCLLSTVGYAVHRALVDRMVDAVDRYVRVEVPLRITRWVQRCGIGVDYTWPSLVDHRDGYSTIAHRRVTGRRAHRHGVAEDWDTGSVALGPVPGCWSADTAAAR